VTTAYPATDLKRPTAQAARAGLRVTKYDRVASLLIALLILVGSATLLMLILWLTSRIFATEPPVPVTLEQLGEGGEMGGGMDLDAPDAEQLGLEVDLEEPMLEETLAVVADVVAANAAILDDPALTEQVETGRGGRTGRGGVYGYGEGSGTGRGRGRHWEIRFSDTTLREYAAQLDYFHIELGVLMPGGRIEYARNLSQGRPERRSGTTRQENRYYLVWSRGDMERFDRQLLDKARIDHQGRIIVKFLEPEVEAMLQRLERAKAGSEYRDVRATYFGVRRQGQGYVFYVIDQVFRR